MPLSHTDIAPLPPDLKPDWDRVRVALLRQGEPAAVWRPCRTGVEHRLLE